MNNPVAPKEGHYALLRNGESRGPIICDRNVHTGNNFFICPADNVSWNPIGDSDCGDAFDIIATISPADMQAVASGELERLRAALSAIIAAHKTGRYEPLQAAIEAALAKMEEK